MEIFFLLFGVAAMLMITDIFSSSNDENTALANGEDAEDTGSTAPGLGPQFGDPDAGPPEGATLDIDDEFARFVLGEGYAGGGTLSLPAGFENGMIRAGIDISALTEDADFVLDRDGNFTLTVGGLPPTLINLAIGEITLGKGDDTVDLRRADEDDFDPEGVIVNAAEGTNKIDFGRDLAGVFNLSGGDNTVLAKGATVTITGGDNTLINTKLSSMRAFHITLEPNADSDTIVEGARVRLNVVYSDFAIAESREFEADPPVENFGQPKVYSLTWDGGSFEADQLVFVTEDFSSFYDPTLPENVSVSSEWRIDPLALHWEWRSMVFVVGEDFEGGGTFDGSDSPRGGSHRGFIDLTEFRGNVTIEDDQFGQPLLVIEGREDNPTLLKDARTVKLGPGENLVTAQSIGVIAQDGQNRIEADPDGLRKIRLEGGVNTITQSGLSTFTSIILSGGSSFILGGENTFFIEDETVANFVVLPEAETNTFIRGGAASGVTFRGSGDDLTINVKDSGIVANWTEGSLELDGRGEPIGIAVAPKTTIDLTEMTDSMDYELRIFVRALDPDVTVIGELNDNITIVVDDEDY